MRNKVIVLAFISWSVLAVPSTRAQSEPMSGLYQIMAGRYEGCCGLVGIPQVELLPSDAQAFVELTVDRQRNVVEMKFLGRDLRTVFQKPPHGPQSGFVYAFTNGMIFQDHIQFGAPLAPPPDKVQFNYFATNSADTLRINGWLYLPCLGCADWPVNFSHVDVRAVAVPAPTVRVSQVEVCWLTASNRTYRVEYRSTLTTNAWVDLGHQVLGNGSVECITDFVPGGQPQRYYRIVCSQ